MNETRAAKTLSKFDWWSFQSLRKSRVPRPDDVSRNPIDAFVLARLRAKNLEPNELADRRTLIRRVFYDLTGLPPSPERIKRFVDNPDPQAYSRIVEELLNSNQYGEHWARHWLDVVKYADTCGYDKDKLRPNAWPYRDYVIRSLNEDKPYSQFIKEQIAGDYFYPGERDGILGLGFVSAGPWDFIGHVEVPESKIDGLVARNLDRDEMVSNTLNTFCSITIQCARCHDHKFDPFTQEHYYSLQAIFAAIDRADRPYDLDPAIVQQKNQLDSSIIELTSKLTDLKNAIRADGGKELTTLETQLQELQEAAKPKEKPVEHGYHSQIASSPQTNKWVEIVLPHSTPISEIVLRPCHDDYAGIGAGFGFPKRFIVTVQSSSDSPQKQIYSVSDRDLENPGLEPVRIQIVKQQAQTIRITATKLAERKNDYIFALAELQILNEGGTNIAKTAIVRALDSIEAPPRWRRSNLVDGRFPSAGNPKAAAELPDVKTKLAAIRQRLDTPERVRQRNDLTANLADAKKELNELPAGKMVYAAATSFKSQGNFHATKGKPRPIHVLIRGNVQTPGPSVSPGVVPLSQDAVWKLKLSPMDSEAAGRAAIATWISDRNNPLTWRSIVNRIWQYHFGTGLVASANDFGRMGRQPTHPELLDWLARDFRDSGQSMKKLHRLIVTSNTYRRTTSHNAQNAQIDNDNQFLWRANRRRLTAEEIRDSILLVSGSLNTKMGGPGFYLFKLEKTDHSPHYEYHLFDPNDENSHRRSVYRFVVRSQPDPFMTTLDCADSSQSTPRRNETLTSLQALTLLNNKFNLAMAERFARRLENHDPNEHIQVAYAFELATGRAASKDALSLLMTYKREHGLENLCRILFNMSEFVFVD